MSEKHPEGAQNVELIITADEEVAYEVIVQIMDLARLAGIENMTLGVALE